MNLRSFLLRLAYAGAAAGVLTAPGCQAPPVQRILDIAKDDFDRLDRDGDGTVARPELLAADFSRDEVDEVFRRLDTDRSNALSRGELAAAQGN